MQEEYRMSLRGIVREYETHPNTVRAYLNVFKLPDEYQQMVWDREIPIRNIQAAERLFQVYNVVHLRLLQSYLKYWIDQQERNTLE
jgi:hypothetical protein